MKTRLAFILICILIVLFFLGLHQHRSIQSANSLLTTNASQVVGLILLNKSPTIVSTNDRIPTPKEFVAMKPERDKIRQTLAEKVHNEWKTPIDFYGRVVDESNNAVAGAGVHFIWNDLSEKGTSEVDTKSDGNGFFSLTGKSGKGMTVYVSKKGYYEYAPSGLSFNYAGDNQNFVPDAGNPVVFHLRKKSEGTDLIHYEKSFQLPTDGTPILIDLPTGKVTALSQNAIKVQVWIYKKIDRWKFNWKCRVVVPGGGLQAYDEEFPFLAPETDYTNEEVIEMMVSNNPSWSNHFRRNYYVHTADGNYGRMVFKMVPAGDHFCELNLYFNPSGSRNLEPR